MRRSRKPVYTAPWKEKAQARARELLPVIAEARKVVKASRSPGGIAAEAAHYARLQTAVRDAEREGLPGRRLSVAILKEAKARQARLFNPQSPTRGAKVWDPVHHWTAEVVRCWTEQDGREKVEVCELRKAGHPAKGYFTPGIEIGDVYVMDARRLKLRPATKNPAKPKKDSQATKAVRLVEHALKSGVVLHFSTNNGEGTAGAYHPAAPTASTHAPGHAQFAVFRYSRTRGNTDATFPSAFSAADHLVEWIGVGNAIAALKRAARKAGTTYANLDTPIRWKKNPVAEPIAQGLIWRR